MTSCSHQMLALLSAVYILIFFLGGLPAVHARSDHASVKHFCGLEFSYAVMTACGEAKRSIRSAPFFDMFPVFKSPGGCVVCEARDTFWQTRLLNNCLLSRIEQGTRANCPWDTGLWLFVVCCAKLIFILFKQLYEIGPCILTWWSQLMHKITNRFLFQLVIEVARE